MYLNTKLQIQSVHLIITQDDKYGYDILQDQHSAKAKVHKSKQEQHSNVALAQKDVLPPSLAHAMDPSQGGGVKL